MSLLPSPPEHGRAQGRWHACRWIRFTLSFLGQGRWLPWGTAPGVPPWGASHWMPRGWRCWVAAAWRQSLDEACPSLWFLGRCTPHSPAFTLSYVSTKIIMFIWFKSSRVHRPCSVQRASHAPGGWHLLASSCCQGGDCARRREALWLDSAAPSSLGPGVLLWHSPEAPPRAALQPARGGPPGAPWAPRPAPRLPWCRPGLSAPCGFGC